MPQSTTIYQDRRGNANSQTTNYWPTGNYQQIGNNLDALRMLRALYEYKWIILLVTLVTTSLAVIYATSVTPLYQSTSTLLVGARSRNIIAFDQLVGDNKNDDNYIQTQVELLRSRELANKVIGELNLAQSPELLPAAEGKFTKLKNILNLDSDSNISNISKTETALKNQIINNFLSKLSITQIDFTKLIEITYESEQADVAAGVANSLAKQYISSYADQKSRFTNEASESLSTKLSELKLELDTSEQNLLNFKLENNIIDLDGTAGGLNEQELLVSASELIKAKNKLLQVTNLLNEVNRIANNQSLLESLPEVYNDPLIRQTRLDLHEERRRTKELTNKYGEKHPKNIDAQSRIASLQNSLRNYTSQVVRNINKDYELLTQQVALLELTLDTGKSSIQKLAGKKIIIESLTNEVDTNREIYNTFLNRMLESKSTQGFELSNAEISEYAYPAADPFKPKKQIIILLAALGSLIFTSLLVLLYRMFDDSVSNIGDVQNNLNLKLLGIVPTLDTNRSKQGFQSKSKNQKIKSAETIFKEAINTLRTNISLLDENGPNKVLLITSSVPGEGKSTAAYNLAKSIAGIERVILIDADMRRPSLSNAMALKGDHPGLSNLLAGTTKPADCIQLNTSSGFDFIGSGSTNDQPLALLSSNAFKKMVDDLSLIYERVIIDCAPVHAVSDAIAVGTSVDSVIYIIKAHQTSAKLARRGIELLKSSKSNVIGAVITQVNLEKLAKFGTDYDFQGFHDYYGYSQPVSASPDLKITRADIQRINKINTKMPRPDQHQKPLH